MRAPFQVLVIPYRSMASALEFAVLKRSGANDWQFVAGGGDPNRMSSEPPFPIYRGK